MCSIVYSYTGISLSFLIFRPAPAAAPSDGGDRDNRPPAGSDADRQRWLAGRIDTLIGDADQLTKARIGVTVRDLGSDQTLYDHDGLVGLNVASNAKLVTTAAALALLGPGFKFETSIHAEKIDEPMLMIHGKEDPNSGTFPMQSERMFAAMKGLGGTTRLVMLPHESHGYRARESIMHMLWEMSEWMDRYVKGAEAQE